MCKIEIDIKFAQSLQNYWSQSYWSQVQVQRRETERQIQNKLNSHAYISRMEAEEEWVDVDVADSSVADRFWERLSDGPSDTIPMSLSRSDYLTAILPGIVLLFLTYIVESVQADSNFEKKRKKKERKKGDKFEMNILIYFNHLLEQILINRLPLKGYAVVSECILRDYVMLSGWAPWQSSTFHAKYLFLIAYHNL